MRSQLMSKICEQENYESYGCFLNDIQMTSFSKEKYPFLSLPMSIYPIDVFYDAALVVYWLARSPLEQNVEFFAINVCSVNLLVFTVPQPPIHLNFKVVNLNALTFSSDFPGDTNSNIKGSTTLRSFPVRAL